MLQDIRFGLRILARNPSVTALSTIALALGIGGSTLIFSVVYAVLLKPLPVADPDRLVWIWTSIPSRNLPFSFTAYSTYAEWKAGSPSFESMSAYAPASATLLVGNEPERLDVLRVNAAFFTMLGISPVVGRNFLAEEDQPGAPRVAILSYALWERRFGRDTSVIGRSINLDGESVAVTGVLPRGFAFGAVESTFPNRTADIYVPIAHSTARGTRGAPSPSVGVYARLRPGVPIERAQAEIDAVSRRLEAAYADMKGWGAQVWRVRDFTVRDVRLSLLVLFGAVGLVLLIACANVANLLLVRASVRQREIALRTALGAGRWRILRQLLTESVILGLCGGVAGLALAAAGTRLVALYGPERIPFLKEVSLDGRVFAFAILASLLTGILFGLAPALAAFRARLSETLKEGSITAGESRPRNRFRGVLVVIEVAIAMLLTIGATLTMRTLLRLQATNPGFDAEGVLTASITLPTTKYANPGQRFAFYQRLLDRVRVMPGVQAASMVSLIPLGGSNTGRDFIIEGQPAPRPEDAPIFWRRVIDPDYFRVMRIPLVRGREFTSQDAASPRIAIINEAMARRFWPDTDPVGKRFGNGRSEQSWLTVVGVVGDVKFTSLTKDAELEFYELYRQVSIADMILTVRTVTDPQRLAPALRQAVLETDPTQPISRITPMAQYVSDAMGTPRMSALLLAAFGTTALVLAAVGIYGVISFSVTRRTREIGVRIALGAAGRDVMRTVVGEAVALASVGIAIGIGSALALNSVMQRMLFGVTATEPSTYLAVSALLIAIAALAAYVPARRATRIDPSVALRCE
ncbi:MAG: ABC transporter permease [Bryobacteraceae bacterium]